MALVETDNRQPGLDPTLVEALASALGIAIAIYDRHDTLVVATPQFRQFFNVPTEHLMPGARLREILGAVYDSGVRLGVAMNGRVRNVSREDWIAERIAVHWRERHEGIEELPDGRWIRLNKRRMPDGCLVTVIADITEQKRRDTELVETRHQAELAQHILDNLANPVIVKDSQLRYVIVNDAFCRIPGFHSKNVIGRTAADLVEPDMAARFEEIERRVLDTGVPFEVIEDIVRSDGTVMHAITRARRSGTAGNYYVTVSFDDVGAFAARETYQAQSTSRYDIDHEPAGKIAAADRDGSARPAPKGRILVLDEDATGAARRASALQANGADALAISNKAEIMPFLDAARSAGLQVSEVEITPALAQAMAAMAGTERHPVLARAISLVLSRVPASGGAKAASLAAPKPAATLGAAEASLPPPPPSAPAPAAIKTSADREAETRKNRVRILVAEDNDVNQIVFEQILEGIGVDFRIVANGEEAVAAWRAAPPDLILMDVSMPVMNGLQATQAIRAAEASADNGRPHVPIIAVTAHAMSGDRERCFAAGMDDYLSKPVSPEKLESMIRNWVETSRPAKVAL